MKYFTIYQITNNINNKYYIGKHITDNPYDSYMGSGKAIIRAIKKYGKEKDPRPRPPSEQPQTEISVLFHKGGLKMQQNHDFAVILRPLWQPIPISFRRSFLIVRNMALFFLVVKSTMAYKPCMIMGKWEVSSKKISKTIGGRA